MTTFLYNSIFLSFSLFSFPFFFFRLRQAADPGRLMTDRRGQLSSRWLAQLDGRDVIWVHAVSVGEVLGAGPFLEKAQSRFPQYQFVLSTTTPTGFAMAEGLGLPVFYAPFDLSWITDRVMETLNPKALLLMETELWPNLIRSAQSHGVCLGLINGRLSPRSFKRYIWVRQLVGPLLQYFSFIAVQTEGDRDRFKALGAREAQMHITGNMKFDRTTQENAEDPDILRAELGMKPTDLILLAGSTHSGEEALVLDVAGELRKKFPSLKVILAPRHVDRADRIFEMAKGRRFHVARYSEPTKKYSVMVLDVMGKLRGLYGLADVVFIGGSMIKHGGQNPIEAARCRRGVITGPFVFNFQAVFDLMVEEKAAFIVHSRAEFKDVCQDLLGDRLKRSEMGKRTSRKPARCHWAPFGFDGYVCGRFGYRGGSVLRRRNPACPCPSSGLYGPFAKGPYEVMVYRFNQRGRERPPRFIGNGRSPIRQFALRRGGRWFAESVYA